VFNGTKWVSSSTPTTKSSARQSMALGGSSMGSSGDILMVEATGTSMDYVGIIDTIGAHASNTVGVITPGKKGFKPCPYNLEVVEWSVMGNATGSCVWDVNWSTTGDWPNTASVAYSETGMQPRLSTKVYDEKNLGITGWTKRVFNKGDMLEFELDSVSGMSACTVSLGVRRLP
jgi:hypothetical protein